MTDKIEEELKKEIEEDKINMWNAELKRREGVLRRLPKERFEGKDKFFNRMEEVLIKVKLKRAKLSQHIATKQAMIKDEIEFLDGLKIQYVGDIANDTDFVLEDIEKRQAKLNAKERKLGELK